jgi:uncharacterized protein DUF3365
MPGTCALGLLLLLIAFPVKAQDRVTLESSRQLAQRFGLELQSALQQALASGSPEQAIAVCRDEAPQIASKLARQSGAKIGRTSRRYRNPMNAPEQWEEAVLANLFQVTAEETDKRIEFFATEQGVVRYMQAIRMGGVCLTCHGASLTSSVEELLDSEYPRDRARGYGLNELRGAFSITWPNAFPSPKTVPSTTTVP